MRVPQKEARFQRATASEDPHPTRLRRATFSHEWEKERGPIIAPILRLLLFPRGFGLAPLRGRGVSGVRDARPPFGLERKICFIRLPRVPDTAAVPPTSRDLHILEPRGRGCFGGFTPGRSRARRNASPRPIDFVRPSLDHGSAREPIRRLASPAGTGAGPYIRPPSPARAPSPWSTPSWTGAADV